MSANKPTEAALQLAAQCWCTPQTEHKVMDVELATEFARVLEMQARMNKSFLDEKDKKIKELETINHNLARDMRVKDENHNMQLAAISTATIQNTRSSTKDRLFRTSPYWTIAYGDVCVAIDREMNHREYVVLLEAKLRAASALAFSTSNNDNETTIKDLRNEVKRLRNEVIWCFQEDGPPKYIQGYDKGANEINNVMVAEEANFMIMTIIEKNKETEQLKNQIKGVREWNEKIGTAVERMLASSDPKQM